jgi:multiple antibiotic resistance protein
MGDQLISAAVAFFVAIDPVGVAALFAGLTVGQDPAQKHRMALRGTAIAAGVLLVFALIGEAMMTALGIGLPALRIAGGILLLLLAIDMVFARPSGMRGMTEPETLEAGHRSDISVFPLAVPLLAGPGAITLVILFMNQAAGQMIVQAAILGIMLGILGLALVCLWFSIAVTRVLGVTGVAVLHRVLGIVLAALACQFVLDGLAGAGLA